MKLSDQTLKSRIDALCKAVEENDSEAIELHLDWLTVLREVQVAEQLKELRDLLTINIEDERILSATSELTDASDRLQYVLESTEKAAEETLDLAETIGEELLALRDQVEDIHREKIDHLLGQVQALIMAQEYQDLTGQVLKRMIPAMEGMQKILEKLIAAAGHNLEELKKRDQDLMKGAGPNVTRSGKEDAVSSQDEVDDLLDSLGL
ncbi:MAG TPA: hypothetical protein EYP05_08960 [Piscirickettsiaceae bacterium]|nr:hypothetical protein [Piscirickettsiaceae bacterium]HIQ40736.1 hypothetical protein [Sulfurivirga caldicuralii]